MGRLMVDISPGFALSLEKGAENQRVLSVRVTFAILRGSNPILISQLPNFFRTSDFYEILFSSIPSVKNLDIGVFSTNITFFLRKVHGPR